MSRSIKEPCGCRHDGHRWIQFNPACTEHVNDLHERANREFRERHAERAVETP